MTRLLLDENVPAATAKRLRAAGIDVALVVPGSADRAILERARAEARVLVTFDRDFGFLAIRGGAAIPTGIVYLRLLPSTPDGPAEALLGLLAAPGVELAGRLTVVERGRVRQRPLQRP